MQYSQADIDAANEDARRHGEQHLMIDWCARCHGGGEDYVFPNINPSPDDYNIPCPTCGGHGVAFLWENRKYRKQVVDHHD